MGSRRSAARKRAQARVAGGSKGRWQGHGRRKRGGEERTAVRPRRGARTPLRRAAPERSRCRWARRSFAIPGPPARERKMRVRKLRKDAFPFAPSKVDFAGDAIREGQAHAVVAQHLDGRDVDELLHGVHATEAGRSSGPGFRRVRAASSSRARSGAAASSPGRAAAPSAEVSRRSPRHRSRSRPCSGHSGHGLKEIVGFRMLGFKEAKKARGKAGADRATRRGRRFRVETGGSTARYGMVYSAAVGLST